MPTYEGFAVEPAMPTAGDSIVFTAVQSKKGHLLYHADYKWVIDYYTTDSEGHTDTIQFDKKNSVVYDLENGDPSVKVKIPDGNGGTIQAYFRADFRYSAMGTNGADGRDYSSGSMNGLIVPRSSSTSFGYCDGSTRKIRVLPNSAIY
ncbi:MAG: hypothetical protein K5945_03145 [Bacteroidaceae bacterium]|nr:hypothetical protein [Bacteroidaceae bacterium]